MLFTSSIPLLIFVYLRRGCWSLLQYCGFVYLFSSIISCFTYFAPLLLPAYTLSIALSPWCIHLFYHYIMSFSVSANFLCSEISFMWYYSQSCFLLMFTWHIFHSFTFCLPTLLYLKWVFYEQHIAFMFFNLLYESLSFNWCI